MNVTESPRFSRRFYSLRDLTQITGLSRTTLWRMERAEQFPRRRQLTPGRVAWLASDVDAWATSRDIPQAATSGVRFHHDSTAASVAP